MSGARKPEKFRCDLSPTCPFSAFDIDSRLGVSFLEMGGVDSELEKKKNRFLTGASEKVYAPGIGLIKDDNFILVKAEKR